MLKEYENYFQGKNIIVTGGLGFIGSNLVNRLAKLNPARIIIIDSKVPGLGANLFNIKEIEHKVEIPDINSQGLDMSNTEKIKELLNKGIDCVFNLAGSVSHIGGKNSPLNDLDLNLRTHVSFLQACREHIEKEGISSPKVLFTGTRDQYGRVSDKELPAREEFTIKEMVDPQGIHNNAAEFHHFWYRQFGIKSTSLRLANTYGPRHPMAHPSQGFANWFIRQAMNNEQIQLWGGGVSLRDFNYVDDVVEALLMAMASPKTDGQVYNLGAFRRKNGKYEEVCGNIKTVSEIANLITKIAQSGSCVEIPYPEEKRSIEVGHFYSDTTKIYNELGWEPQVPIEEGIRRTIEFYRKYKENYWN